MTPAWVVIFCLAEEFGCKSNLGRIFKGNKWNHADMIGDRCLKVKAPTCICTYRRYLVPSQP